MTKGPVTIEADGVNSTLKQTEWSPKNENTFGKVQFTMTAKAASGNTAIRVTLENADPAFVGNIVRNEGVVETMRYNTSGQYIDSPQKGINIIRYSDGTTKKVFIK